MDTAALLDFAGYRSTEKRAAAYVRYLTATGVTNAAILSTAISGNVDVYFPAAKRVFQVSEYVIIL
jgi:hypothetical protein